MNLTLYQISDQFLADAAKLADMDLPDDVLADTLEGLSGELEAKSVNVAAFARNLEATAEQIKQAETAMAERRKALENRAGRIRAYLLQNMQRTGITEISCPHFKLSVRNNPASVQIEDAAAIPQEYMRQPEPPPPAPDKKLIAEVIKSGKEVPGCRLTQSQRLEIK
ncbi:MAG: siphovirus Gp157 family protein [Methylobacillus sp.]|jgi:hypothetical protein|nr:siphovirus Gp157 family protein [Methylobacillus sp.]